MSGMRATSSTVALYLVTGSKAGMSSTSWYTPRNLVLGSRPPVTAMIGERASHASRRPAARLSAPMTCAMQTPGLPEARA